MPPPPTPARHARCFFNELCTRPPNARCSTTAKPRVQPSLPTAPTELYPYRNRNSHRQTVEGSPPLPVPPPATLALPPPPNVLHGQPRHGGDEKPDNCHQEVDADDSDSASEASEYDEERSVSSIGGPLAQALCPAPPASPRALGTDPAFLMVIEEGRIYIDDSIAPLQHHGVVHPTLV